MRGLLGMLAVPLGLYAALCALLFFAQRSQIYFPVPETNAPGASPLKLARSGIELKIWVVMRPGPKAVLYFGGNAEDVAANIAPFSEAIPEHSLYFMNYRGYGGSGGRPSERDLVDDAVALYDEVRPRHAGISVIGRSLGSGVAVQLASARDVKRLVLVTPFDSLVNVAHAHYPWLPVALLLRDRYDSASRAADIVAPTLVVTAGSDEIIPRARSLALVSALPPSRTRVVTIEGARHNELDLSGEYLESLRRFLDY